MSSKLKRIREVIASTARKIDRIDVPQEVVDEVRAELGIAPGEPLVIDGVPVHGIAPRDLLIVQAMAFTKVRWGVLLSRTDMESLLKAVPTEELKDLVPLIVNQQMDDHEYHDPVQDMTDREIAAMRKEIEEIGFVDTSL